MALLTDLYQLTMAYGYWKEGIDKREAVFQQFFRRAPFGSSFAIAAGLETATEWLKDFQFSKEDIDYLGSLCGSDNQPLFDKEFLRYLNCLQFECDLDAVAEGSLVFAQEPLVRVRGPLLQCQLIETALLNIINFQTLIATKAARVCLSAAGDPVFEFGLRRAHGPDGGLSASRAAYIGGCDGTSNLLAGKLYGIPVRGTHAHSWVMAFDTELEAFESYGSAMPNNCVFLVDTYDTIEGVQNAIKVGMKMRKAGLHLAGIRLDSGNLSSLSRAARRLLTEAGLDDTVIIASSDLDEYSIADLKQQGTAIGIWGVGTSIATAGGDSALGGVYKLSLLRGSQGEWQYKMKHSDDAGKSSTPGMLQVRRYSVDGFMTADLIYDELHAPESNWSGTDPLHKQDSVQFSDDTPFKDLLNPVLRTGKPVVKNPALDDVRLHCQEQLALLPAHLLDLNGEFNYPVMFEAGLQQRCEELMNRASADSSGQSLQLDTQ